MMYRHPHAGTGKAVVMLHGLGATGASFDGLVAALDTGRMAPHVFDLHGFGQSAPLSKTTDPMAAHAQAVVAAMDGVEGPIAVVGHSMGGRIALLVHAALKSDGRAGPLVLIAPAIRSARLELVAQLVLGSIMDKLFGTNPIQKTRRLLETVRVVPPSNADVAKYRVNFEDGKDWFAVNGPSLGTDLQGFGGLLKGVTDDVLMVWGAKDKLTPITQADALLAANSKATLETITGAGHIPHEERPEAAVPPIVTFLERWAAKAG